MPATRIHRPRLAVLFGAMFPLAAIAAVPLAPSPAGSAATNRCPNFQWHGDGAASVEIEVYRLAGGSGALEGPVLRTSIAGPVTRWTASGSQCLGPGPHAWSVRSLPDGAWSDPLMFEVGGVPSDAELEAAVAVIERYLAQRGAEDTDPAAKAPIRQKGAGDVTALQGLVPDGAGTTRGVHGSVASPSGVGVLAENTHPSGFDLQLAGPVPAQVNEREWRLAAATPQSVNFTNPSGSMSVLVQGQPLITAATDQNTTYSPGNQLALAGTTFNVVEGAGSGLDADTVDGVNVADLAGVAHTHAGQTWTSGGQSTLVGSAAALLGGGFEGRNSIGAGLIGSATATTGANAIGVRASTQSTSGIGVSGSAFANSGPALGIYGLSNSLAGAGGLFSNDGGGLLLAASNASTPTLAGLEFSVDNDGDVVAKSFAGDGRLLTGTDPSMFRRFGGDGSNGALVVSTTAGTSVRRQYTSLTINTGATLTMAPNGDGRTYIAVQGRCTIRGTINARGAGAPGPIILPPPGTLPGQPGRDAFSNPARAALPNCVSGAGGAGGPVPGMRAGNGGGAQADGGDGNDGDPGGSSDSWKRLGISGGGFGVRDGGTGQAGFAAVLACPGASGGTGATLDEDGANSTVQTSRGGYGGGVVYLECGELELATTGVIDARGANGLSQTCTGSDCAIRDGTGGDGGGGGGVVLIRTRQIVDQSGQILVSGGLGGNGAGWLAERGGDGANGYADILLVE
ncbi:MAG: hypothetical protein KA280_03690 [Thermomonas sp.]|nr:hypothetical protein [Thermomonas sp.]